MSDQERIIRTEDDVKQAYLEARVLTENEKYDEAESLLRSALNFDRKNSFCLRQLALVYKEQKLYDKEEKVLLHAHEIYPKDAYFVGDLAKLYVDTKQWDQAEEFTDKKEDLNKKTRFTEDLDLQNQQIICTYRIEISNGRGDNDGRRKWDKELRKVERKILGLPGGAKLSEKMLSYINDNSKLTIMLSKLDAEGALKLSDKLLKENPGNVMAVSAKIKALFMMGKYQQADNVIVERYNNIVRKKLTPEQRRDSAISIYMQRAQAKMGMGSFDEAKKWLGKVMEVDNNIHAAAGLMNAIYIDEGKVSKAEELTKLMEERGDLYGTKYRGLMQMKSKDPEQFSQGVEKLYTFLHYVPDMLLLKYMRTLASNDTIDRERYNGFIGSMADAGLITRKIIDELTASSSRSWVATTEGLMKMTTAEVANISENRVGKENINTVLDKYVRAYIDGNTQKDR